MPDPNGDNKPPDPDALKKIREKIKKKAEEATADKIVKEHKDRKGKGGKK